MQTHDIRSYSGGRKFRLVANARNGRQLKILAAEQETTVQALTAEALNLLFEKNGKPQMARP